MTDTRTMLSGIALGTHVLAAGALVILATHTPAMAIFCIVAAALIGCGAVQAVPDRPVTLYAAFGVLMGFAFWMVVSAVNQGALLTLVPVLLLAAGAVWLLNQPRWPAAVFSAVVAILFIGLAVVELRHPERIDDAEPELVRRGAITTLVVLVVGLVYVGLGVAQASLSEPRKKRRKRRRRSVPLQAEPDE